MKTKFIKDQEQLYKTIGTQHNGFDVYKINSKWQVEFIGRSHCDTPRMAVNDVLARQYKRYY